MTDDNLRSCDARPKKEEGIQPLFLAKRKKVDYERSKDTQLSAPRLRKYATQNLMRKWPISLVQIQAKVAA